MLAASRPPRCNHDTASGPTDSHRRLAPAVAVLYLVAQAAAAQGIPEPPGGWDDAVPPAPSRQLPEDLRRNLDKVILIAAPQPGDQDVTGTYEKATQGLLGGMAAGSRLGRFEKQVGPVPIVIPVPILRLPGAIFGGLSGATKRQIQDFRDELTEELVEADSRTLSNDGIALDVFWGLRKLPSLQSQLVAPTVELPADTDAVIYIALTGMEIDVQGKEAIITTSAGASVQPVGPGAPLFETEVRYQDRDTLRNWTANDNRLWRDYVNYARHYLGRELAAALFDRVAVGQSLAPVETGSVRQDRRQPLVYESETTTPTLAWNLELRSSDAAQPWTATIAEDDIFYDIEIYDANQIVYFEEQVPDPRHTVAMALEPCKDYRWSVRPAFRVGDALHFGDWMRIAPPPADDDGDEEKDARPAAPYPGLSGRQASTAPAYTQDFPALNVACD